MSAAALVGATDFNEDHFLSMEFDCVIAVDGGYASLKKAGVQPDYVLGDFDSLGFVPDDDGVRCFSPEKDESDMQLALCLAEEQGFGPLYLYGAFAGRIDHTIANIQLLARYARKGSSLVGIGDAFAMVMLDGKGLNTICFKEFDPCILDSTPYGRFISVFAYGGTASGATERGLKYHLCNAPLPDDCSLGLSNEFTGSEVSIRLEGGNVLVVFSLGALPYMKVDHRFI
ncbi:MAG: thiamine diphosphokinase [Eggerthellaceae bacterium]